MFHAKRTTEKDKLRVEQLYREGKSYGVIASAVGFSERWVTKLVFGDRGVYYDLKRRADSHCENCRKYVKNGHAHHIQYNPLGEITTLENLLYLCALCHRMIHAKSEEQMRFDISERLQICIPKQLRERIKTLQQKTGMTTSRIIRESMRSYLDEMGL
jgi:hypothetical protein